MYYLNNLCFLCLTYNKNVLYHVNNCLEVQDKLKHFLPEQVLQKTEIPKHVCDNCVERLNSINKFRRKCLNNITIFNDYIQKLNQESTPYKHLSIALTDMLPSARSKIVNQISNTIKNKNEKQNFDGNVKSEIFETESFEPIKDDRIKDIYSGSSNMEQIYIKTENIGEFSGKKEINELIIKDEPFSFEDIPQEEENEPFDEINYHCDTTSINNRQENFGKIRRGKNHNENIHLLSDECSSSYETPIINDTRLTKSDPVEREDEIQNRQINSDECNIQKKLEINNDVDTEGKSYTCDVCQKQFKKKTNLSQHKRIHTGERPFVCNICGKAFKYRSNLMSHKHLHSDEKPYECDICKKTFKIKYRLMEHIHIHTGEKSYECNVCQRQFKKKTNLFRHKQIHTGERPFVCNICEKSFRDNSVLMIHKRLHTDEKPYECDVCKKAFTIKYHLIEHTRIHTGEKPYGCNVCQKRFMTSSHFNRHKLMHTTQTFHSCDVCNKKFKLKIKLNQHKLIHTDSKPTKSASIKEEDEVRNRQINSNGIKKKIKIDSDLNTEKNIHM